MQIHAIPAETLAKLGKLVNETQGSVNLSKESIAKPAAPEWQADAKMIIATLRSLNASLTEPEVNMSEVQEIMENFNQQTINLSNDENLKNDPKLKEFLTQTGRIISTLHSDPLYTYLVRISDMENALHIYATILTNNKITEDINTLIKTAREDVTALLEKKPPKLRSSWLNFTFFITSRKVPDNTTTAAEELKRTTNFQKVNQILENISTKFLSSQVSLEGKVENTKTYGFLFNLEVKGIDSEPARKRLTELKNNIIKYDFLKMKEVASDHLKKIIDAQTENKLAEFAKTPIGAYVIAKRDFDEKSLYFNLLLQKSSENDDILQKLQEKVDACKTRLESIDDLQDDLIKANAFNFINKNNYELLSMMLPADQYNSFIRQIQNSIKDSIKKTAEPELSGLISTVKPTTMNRPANVK